MTLEWSPDDRTGDDSISGILSQGAATWEAWGCCLTGPVQFLQHQYKRRAYATMKHLRNYDRPRDLRSYLNSHCGKNL